MVAAQSGRCSARLIALVVAFCAGACGSKKESGAANVDTDPHAARVASGGDADRAIDAAPAEPAGELHVGVGPCGLGSKPASAGEHPSKGAGPKAAPKLAASETVTVTPRRAPSSAGATSLISTRRK